jgi:hypothetical protein
MLPEFACTEDATSPGLKPTWFAEAVETLKALPAIRASAYTDTPGSDDAVDSSSVSLAGFRKLALDPYFAPIRSLP